MLLTMYKEDHWAARDIDLLTAREIVSGYSDGTYRPGKGVTRAEFTVLLIKALNLEDTAATLKAAGQLFRDVNGGYWAKGYIHLAWELGVVGGYPDGTFRPENTIRRDEMVAMLVRALT
ncbi:MAG: S-layer homology domain-containing protein [Zhaonellaceae bacterium]